MSDKTIAKLAGSQHALITWEQVRRLGMTHRQVQVRLKTGRWEQVHLGVYRLAGSPETYAQRLLAACLALGDPSCASHRAAATLHDVLAFKDPPVEVTTTRLRSPELSGVVVHRLADLHASFVEERDGIPCTNVARTLVDLGAVCRPSTVEAAFDRAIGRRVTVPREVRKAMLAVARQGRRGVGAIRGVLSDRIEDRPASVLSARMSSLVLSAMLPVAVPEYVVRDAHGGFVAVVDFAYPDRKLAIEVDGYEAHTNLRAFRHDRSRDRALREHAWEVLHFTWHEVDQREPHVARAIREWHRKLG